VAQPLRRGRRTGREGDCRVGDGDAVGVLVGISVGVAVAGTGVSVGVAGTSVGAGVSVITATSGRSPSPGGWRIRLTACDHDDQREGRYDASHL